MRRPLLGVLLIGASLVGGSPAGAEPAKPTDGVAAGPLRTAVVDPGTFSGRQSRLAFRRTHGAGATYVRLILSWRGIAPRRVAGDRSDPDHEGYSWAAFDAQVRNAHAAGLTPIVCVTGTPTWARDTRAGGRKTTWPKIDELVRFAEAAAWRYSGYYEGAPEVHVWQVWNEPNARSNLRPQFRDGRPVSPARYRQMVNAVVRGVRRADATNRVVAGGLSPFGHNSRDIQVVAPLRFLRLLLCISTRYEPTCELRTSFDVWAHHPYTSGGPTHRALARDDVSIGDLPRMRELLEAGVEAGHVRFRRSLEFWVTEFSWDTKPDDPAAVPEKVHARWVAEALYRMWKARVSLVTWFLIRDTPLALSPYQSGLWFDGGFSLARDRPKLSLRAFRFPFVALRVRRAVLVWGRLPNGRPGRVAIERKLKTRWTRLTVLDSDRYGIFEGRLKKSLTGPFRAYWLDTPEISVPFTLRVPSHGPVIPFGCGGAVRCWPGQATWPPE